MTRTAFFALAAAFFIAGSLPIAAVAQQRSILFRNATVIDGTGKPAYRTDVLVVGEKIAKIGSVKPSPADEVIDAEGLVLAPGFIDIHNHSEGGLVREGTAANQVSQGITTLIVGPDGGSPESIADYFKGLEGKLGLNAGAFMGHGTLRTLVMKDDLRRPATADEIAAMSRLLEKAMNEGAFGLSSGLEYDAGFSATTEELIALAKVAARHGGIYMTHMRDEEEGVLDAIREAVRIGKEAGIPVQISHIKMGNRSVWGKSKEAVAIIEEARRAGQDVTADAYPYTAWASTITVLVPSRKHDDPAEVRKGIEAIGGPQNVLITSAAKFPQYEGKTLEQAAVLAKSSPADVYMEIVKNGGAGVIGYGMTEDDVRVFYQTPWVMVASDGGIGSRHPRGSGTFPRVLGKFVREDKWLPLEEAIRKMSALPGERLGLKDRGTIERGKKADLVLFDPKTVTDRATFAEPQLLASGIRATFVNGVRVWDGEKVTGSLPGVLVKPR